MELLGIQIAMGFLSQKKNKITPFKILKSPKELKTKKTECVDQLETGTTKKRCNDFFCQVPKFESGR